jgi:hypothetical protein
VTAFYYEHGIESDLAADEQRALLLGFQEGPVSEDPLRIRISIPLADETLRLTYDDEMEVVDVDRLGGERCRR